MVGMDATIPSPARPVRAGLVISGNIIERTEAGADDN
jgi:hypothetical protein